MLRSELIAKLVDENPDLRPEDLEKVVAVILDEITDALARGDRVELRGFGAFSVRHRKARKGRNPPHRRSGQCRGQIRAFLPSGQRTSGRALMTGVDPESR